MLNENQLLKKLNKYSKELDPTQLQQKRVKNVVFSKDYKDSNRSQSYFNLSNKSIMKIFKSKIFLTFGTLGILAIIFITPLLFLNKKMSIEPRQIDEYSLREEEPQVNTPSSLKNEKTYRETEKELPGEPKTVSYNKQLNEDYASLEEQDDSTKQYEDTETPLHKRVQTRSADLNITVDDFNSRHIELTGKLSAIGGYVVQSNTNSNDSYSYGNFTVRVPVSKFDEFVNFLRNMALKVTRENISIEDRQNELTQVVKNIEDKESRIKTLEEKSILTIEEKNELQNLKRQLEQDENREKQLKQDTEFSTVEIYMTTEKGTEEWNAGSEWSSVLNYLNLVGKFWIKAAMWSLVPIAFLLPVGIIIFIVIKSKRKSKD